MRIGIQGLSVAALLVMMIAPAVAQQRYHTGLIPEETLPSWIEEADVDMSVLRDIDEMVDNSAGLPPVGSQGTFGSCVGWSVGYYTQTYTQGQDYGWDLTDPAHQMSPAFTYNLINGGSDTGSNISDAFLLHGTVGCATVEDMPVFGAGATAYPTETAFRNAMRYRILDADVIYTETQGGLDSLRAHLAAGNVGVFAVRVYQNLYNIENFNFTYCLNDIYGQEDAGHALTVVGFDDSRETSDGIGAFKFVNSWATSWGHNGFGWISYEAMMSYDISWGYVVLPIDRPNYEPSLVVSLEPQHSDRHSLNWTVGVGTPDNPLFEYTWFDFENNSQADRSYPQGAVIVLDLTDAAGFINPDEPNDFYVIPIDEDPGDGHAGEILMASVEDSTMGFTAFSHDVPHSMPDSDDPNPLSIVLYQSAVPPAELNSEVDLSDGHVDLSWSAVAGGADFLGYKLYRNGILVTDVPQTETSVIDTLPGFGVYNYQVASAWESCESELSVASEVDWVLPVAPEYLEAQCVDVIGDNGSFKLTWEQLRPYGAIYDDGSFEQTIGMNGVPAGAMIAQRIVADSDGQLLGLSVFFDEHDPGAGPVRFVVLEDTQELLPGGMLLQSDPLSPPSGDWLSIELGEDRIDASAGQAFWVAVLFEDPGSSLLGMDTSVGAAALKAMCPDGETWVQLGGESNALLLRGSFGADEIVGGNTGLLGFEIYRDGELVETSTSDDHLLQGELPLEEEYTFQVNALYQQGVWESDPLTWWMSVGVDEPDVALPRDFIVGAAYPNPFNPSTTVDVTLPLAGRLRAVLYNPLGQQVTELADGRYRAGSHRLTFDARGLASGVYLLRVTAEGQGERTQKLLYLR